MFRAGVEQAKHELRFLLMSIFGALFFGLVLLEPLQRVYDHNLRPRPFVIATMEIVPGSHEKPDVKYSAWASTNVSGRWSAWVEVDGRRGCGGGGTSGYGPPQKPLKTWEWADWIGKDCSVPLVPFSLCVRYAIETTSGAGDISGPFCSPTYDPNHRKEEFDE